MENKLLIKYYQVLMFDSLEHYKINIKKLSDYISSNNNNPYAFNNRGLAYSEIGMFEEAKRDFEESIRIKPDPIPYKNIGIMMERNNFLDKALDAFNSAINLTKKDATIYRCRAHINGKIGKHQEAIEDFTKAIELEPDFAYTYFERANQLKGINKNKLAAKDLATYNKLKNGGN